MKTARRKKKFLTPTRRQKLKSYRSNARGHPRSRRRRSGGRTRRDERIVSPSIFMFSAVYDAIFNGGNTLRRVKREKHRVCHGKTFRVRTTIFAIIHQPHPVLSSLVFDIVVVLYRFRANRKTR